MFLPMCTGCTCAAHNSVLCAGWETLGTAKSRFGVLKHIIFLSLPNLPLPMHPRGHRRPPLRPSSPLTKERDRAFILNTRPVCNEQTDPEADGPPRPDQPPASEPDH